MIHLSLLSKTNLTLLGCVMGCETLSCPLTVNILRHYLPSSKPQLLVCGYYLKGKKRISIRTSVILLFFFSNFQD